MPNTEHHTEQAPIDSPLSMRELTEVLIKHYGIHEGLHDLMIAYQVGMGSVGPDNASISPGVVIGVSKVGLKPSTNNSPNSVDAALVNPAQKQRKLRP